MSSINFMEKLLDGVDVEWKTLGEIAEIYGGLTGKSKADFENGNAKYISYKNIFNNIEIDVKTLELVKISDHENQHKVRYGDVLFTGSSEIADEADMSSAVTTEFEDAVYLNSFSFGVRFNEGTKITPEFSKYLFRSHFMRVEIAKTASGVTRFNVSKARFKKLQIPIPCPENPAKSLEIQAEIVRILDAFSELISELSARKQQYTYYRDQLLSFDEGEVEWKTLGEVAKIYDGTHQTPKYTESGIPFVSVQNIKNLYGTGKYISIEDFEKYKYKPQKNDLFMTRIGDIGTCAIVENDKPLAYYVTLALIRVNQESIFPQYLKFVIESVIGKSELYKRTLVNAVPIKINLGEIGKIKLPIPPLTEQARIVAILDKFDTLTTSISEGLPREIALRQQQYEYYRDMLLSFPKSDEAMQ